MRPVSKFNFEIESVDQGTETFEGFCYFEDLPAGLADALRVDRGLSEPLEVDIEGTYSVEPVTGEVWGEIVPERLWLIRTYESAPGVKRRIRVEVVPYDVIEDGDDLIREKLEVYVDTAEVLAERRAFQAEADYDALMNR